MDSSKNTSPTLVHLQQGKIYWIFFMIPPFLYAFTISMYV